MALSTCPLQAWPILFIKTHNSLTLLGGSTDYSHMTSYHASQSFTLPSQHSFFLEFPQPNLFQQSSNLSRLPGIHNVARNGIVEHENIIKTLMMSVEKEDDKIGSFDQRRICVPITYLLNCQVVIFAVVTDFRSGQRTVCFN